MSSGIVVDHKEAGVRYAVHEENFDSETMVKVRDLKPGETVLGYQPKGLPTKDADTSAKPTEGEAKAPSKPEATPSGAAHTK